MITDRWEPQHMPIIPEGQAPVPIPGEKRAHPLDYLPPTDEQRELMHEVVVGLKFAWSAIAHSCPPSAERTLALRCLQEARSRANEAILGITIPR